jgi:hypothetical protein
MTPKLEETIYVDFITSAPTTGAAADADTTPTIEVFEDATDTAVLSPTAVKRTSKTGNYRVPIACTAANGFEAGKSYNVVASATVTTVAAKAVVARFQVRAYSVDSVNLTHANGTVITTSDGTAQGGASGYIILAADSSDEANYYQWSIVRIIGGPCDGQARTVTFYDEDTKQANVYPPWVGAPTNESVYIFESCGAVNATMIGGDDDAAAGAQSFFQSGNPTSAIVEAVIAELFGDSEEVEVEEGLSFKESFRAILASAVGKRVVDGSNRHLRNPGDTKNRITFTEDRATASLDLTD